MDDETDDVKTGEKASIKIPSYLTANRNKDEYNKVKSIGYAGGAKFKGVLIEYKACKSDVYIMTVQSIEPGPVEIKYYQNKAEKAEIVKLTTQYPSINIKKNRESVILHPGDIKSYLVKPFATHNIEPMFGSIVMMTNVKFCVDFLVSDEIDEENDNADKFVRYVGDPYIRFSAEADILGEENILMMNEAVQNLNSRLPPFGTASINSKFIDYPEESRINSTVYESMLELRAKAASTVKQAPEVPLIVAPADGGAWVNTFNYAPIPTAPTETANASSTTQPVNNNQTAEQKEKPAPVVEKKVESSTLKCPYNWTIIPNEILGQSKYQKNGYWVYVNNAAPSVFHRDDLVNNRFNLPVAVFNVPGTDKIVFKGGIGSLYAYENANKETKACLKDESGFLSGVVVLNDGRAPIVFSSNKLYEPEKLYGINALDRWKDCAQHLFRGTCALMFMQNFDITPFAEEDQTDLYSGKMSRGYTRLLIDPQPTFLHTGVEVRDTFAINYLLLYRSPQEKENGDYYVESDLSSANVFFSSYVKGKAGKYVPHLINMKEVSGDLNMLFKPRDWVFFIVPSNQILVDSQDQEIFADNTHTAVVLDHFKFYEFNVKPVDHVKNENYITKSWYGDKSTKNGLNVFAVPRKLYNRSVNM